MWTVSHGVEARPSRARYCARGRRLDSLTTRGWTRVYVPGDVVGFDWFV